MGAHEELVLVTKIIDSGYIRPVLQKKVTPDHFENKDALAIFKRIMHDWRKWKGDDESGGTIPTREIIARDFPTIQLPKEDRRSLEVIVDDFLNRHVVQELGKMADFIISWQDSPEEVLSQLATKVGDLARVHRTSRDVELSKSVEGAADRYESNRDSDGVKGIPYPWEVLNHATQGMLPGEFILFYGRPKCVVEGQRVLASDGTLTPIETPPKGVARLEEEEQRITWGGCSGFYAGKKDAVRITTRSGHVIEVGADHPMLLPDLSYTPASELQVGSYVGVARRLPEPTKVHRMGIHKARLLGLLVGDGNYTRNEVQFTKGDTDIIKDLGVLVRSMGASLKQGTRDIEYRILGTDHKNPILDWLRELGCHGQKSKDKHVPQAVFRASNDEVAAFLSGYTDTDGTVTKRGVTWSTASYRLATDVKHLLLRFGITGIITPITTNFDTEAYQLTVSSQEQHRVLHHILRLVCKHKAAKLEELATKEINNKPHDDGIPYSDKLMEEILEAKGDKEWKYVWSGFSRGKLFRRTGRISRHLLRRLAEYLDAPRLLTWANSDIRWEPIDRVEKLGKRDCWDISMDDAAHPTFVVENFITHNSLKTWVLLRLATYAYDFANRRVLVYTREMTPEQMMDRCICLLIGAPYTAFKEGKLKDIPAPYGGNMEEMFYDLLSSMRADEETCALEYGYNKSLIITSDRDDPKGGGVQGLRQKIRDHEADLVCADALYLMRNDRVGGKRSVKWDDQAAITQDLKDLALDINVPLIGTTQAKRDSEERKGKSVANISFSDSYGMDCDLAIEIIKRRLTDETNELALAITGAREINLSGFAIHGNPATSFDMLYEKYSDQAGVEQLDGDGNPLEVPVIFSDYKDIKDFLKKGEADEKPKVSKTRAQYARLAQAAFKDARKNP